MYSTSFGRNRNSCMGEYIDYKEIHNKMENVFINLGFIIVVINGVKFMRYKECYCKITFLKDWNAFVIESADNIHDAEKGVLEDGDIYYTDIPEQELLNMLKSDLIRDYLNA